MYRERFRMYRERFRMYRERFRMYRVRFRMYRVRVFVGRWVAGEVGRRDFGIPANRVVELGTQVEL